MEPEKIKVSDILKSPYYREQLRDQIGKRPATIRKLGIHNPEKIIEELQLIWRKESKLSSMNRKRVQSLCLPILHQVIREIEQYNAAVSEKEGAIKE